MLDIIPTTVKGFDAPFPRLIWEKVFDRFQNKIQDFADIQMLTRPKDFLHFRENLDELFNLGPMIVDPSHSHANRVMRIHSNGEGYNIPMRQFGWMLFFPDYTLIAHPIKPPGYTKIMFPEHLDSCNPLFYRPPRYWGLPEYVYDWFDTKYGVVERIRPPPENLKKFRERRDYLYAKTAKLNGLDRNFYAQGQAKLENLIL